MIFLAVIGSIVVAVGGFAVIWNIVSGDPEPFDEHQSRICDSIVSALMALAFLAALLVPGLDLPVRVGVALVAIVMFAVFFDPELIRSKQED